MARHNLARDLARQFAGRGCPARLLRAVNHFGKT